MVNGEFGKDRLPVSGGGIKVAVSLARDMLYYISTFPRLFEGPTLRL